MPRMKIFMGTFLKITSILKNYKGHIDPNRASFNFEQIQNMGRYYFGVLVLHGPLTCLRDNIYYNIPLLIRLATEIYISKLSANS